MFVFLGHFHGDSIEGLVFGSVSDPFNFNTDHDPQIRFVEERIRILLRIRPKIETNTNLIIPSNENKKS